MTESADLPEGWLRLPLTDAVRPRGEKANPSDHSDAPFIGMDHVAAHSGRIIGRVPAGSMKSSAARFRSGDVLYGRLRPYLNKVARPNFDGLASAEFIVFPENGFVSNSYLTLRLRSRDFVNFSSHLNEGDRPRVDFTQIGAFLIEVPPLPEQHLIVQKIEALFSELEAGEASLTRARAQLALYRQSLLKSAFQGHLTAHWRAANAGRLEPPETLLSRIRTERDTRHQQALEDWQTALTEWRAGGEVGRKPGKPSRPADVRLYSHAIDLPDLPQGWFYVTTDSLGLVETGNTPPSKEPHFFNGDVPFIKPTDLDAGMNVRDSRDTLTKEGLEVSRGFPVGTVLVTCIGATIGKTGLTHVAGACNQQINFIVPDCFVGSTFMFFQVVGPAFQEKILKNASSTTLPILNKGKFCELPFAVCAPQEQAEVIAILEAKLSQVDATESEITTALAKITALRQSILKKAFSGQLVPQDPGDEPASALLSRLRGQTAPSRRKKPA